VKGGERNAAEMAQEVAAAADDFHSLSYLRQLSND
jgi:hypothetical protein